MSILKSAFNHGKDVHRAFNNAFQLRNVSFHKLKDWYTHIATRNIPHIPPYNHVVQIGDPSLRTVSDAVPREYIKSGEIGFLLDTMKKVFKKYKCVGLSATQVGVPLRIIMFEFNREHANCFSPQEQQNREMRLHPFTLVINPDFKISDYAKLIHTEACESVKGLAAEVPRYRGVTLKGFNEKADPIQVDLSGWCARIVQHEVDHLNGVLYTDVMNRKTLTCTCWNVVNEKGGRVVLPYGAS